MNIQSSNYSQPHFKQNVFLSTNLLLASRKNPKAWDLIHQKAWDAIPKNPGKKITEVKCRKGLILIDPQTQFGQTILKLRTALEGLGHKMEQATEFKEKLPIGQQIILKLHEIELECQKTIETPETLSIT